MIFAYDVAGNNASLSLSCIAAGNPSPNIAWYREEQPLADEVVMADGSLLIENIVEGVDATRDGLLYHCTANNTFGIIRSRAANVSYACELKKWGQLWSLWDGYCVSFTSFTIFFYSFQWF